MQVVSVSPLRTGSMLWQVTRGQWALTFVCKATFLLQPGQAELAPEQEPTNEEDSYWNDDPARSLHAPSDMVPYKVRADVLLVGHAFAPNAEPVRQLQARLTVGDVDKTIDVVCDRVWTAEKALAEGARFAKMPLRWERAAGGPDTANPIGIRGRDALPDAYGQVSLPNLQPAGLTVASPSDAIDVIGFGPIAPNWPPRTRFLGRHSQLWVRARRPMEPVPQDLDAGYFNSAPPDQQTEFLRDDERIVLQNLHPEHARLVSTLPGIHPVAYLERSDGAEEIGLTADTLLIDTDTASCTVTWRGRVENPPESGRLLIAMEGPDERLAWSDVERLGRRTGDFTDSATIDLPDMMSTNKTPVNALNVDGQIGSHADPSGPHVVPPLPVATPVKPGRRGVRLPPALTDVDPNATARGAIAEMAHAAEGAPPPISARAPQLRGAGGTKVGPAPQPLLAAIEAGRARARDSISGAAGAPHDTGSDDGDLVHETVATGAAPKPSAARSVLPFTAPGKSAGSSHAPSPPALTPPLVTPQVGGSGASALFRSPAASAPPKPPLPAMDSSGGTVIHEMPPRRAEAAPSWLVTNDHTVADGRSESGRGPSWLAPTGAPSPIAPPATAFPAQPASAFAAPPAATPALPPPPPVSESPWAGGPMSSGAGGLSPSVAPRPPMASVVVAPPPVVDPTGANVVSAAAASNAAAHWSQAQEAPKTTPPPAPGASPEVRRASYATDAVELLWYDPEAVPRLKAYWDELIVELGFDELDPKHDPPSKDPDEARDRHDVFGVLAQGNVLDGSGLQRAMLEAVNDRGRFTPPLVLTAGELTFPLDELEQLRATVAAIAPLIGGDAKLKNTVDAVNELLASGCLMSSSSVVERLTQQLRDAFRESGKTSNAGYLEMHVERILVEQRHYQRRELFGDKFLRTLISIPGAEAQIPAYLPDALSKRLPMMTRLRARVIAELTVQQDQYEVHPHALRVVALGRVVPLDGRRRR